jgi:hypothetical protein
MKSSNNNRSIHTRSTIIIVAAVVVFLVVVVCWTSVLFHIDVDDATTTTTGTTAAALRATTTKQRQRRYLEDGGDVPSSPPTRRRPPPITLLHINALDYSSNIELDDVALNETTTTSSSVCTTGRIDSDDTSDLESGLSLTPEIPGAEEEEEEVDIDVSDIVLLTQHQPADVQITTSDAQCRRLGNCHITSTIEGESVTYNLYLTKDLGDFLDKYKQLFASPSNNNTTNNSNNNIMEAEVTVRLAADINHTKSVEIMLLPLLQETADNEVEEDEGIGIEFTSSALSPPLLSTPSSRIATVFGTGSQNFVDVTVGPFIIDTTIDYQLIVHFIEEDVNMCSVKVMTSPPTPPSPRVDDENDHDHMSVTEVPKYYQPVPFTKHVLPGNCDGIEYHEQFNYDFKVEDLTKTTNPDQLIEYVTGAYNNLETFVYVDIAVRVASDDPEVFEMQLKENSAVVQSQRFLSPGLGDHVFKDVVWTVKLYTSKSRHQLYLDFGFSSTNMCKVTVTYSTKLPAAVSVPVPPYTWPALRYDDAFDQSSLNNNGDGCGSRLDGVDSIRTADKTCNQRDNSFCAVGFTLAGEFLEYHFNVPSLTPANTSMTGSYDVRVRASAFSPDTNVELELWSTTDPLSPYATILDIPFSSNNRRAYHDLIWTPRYPLQSGEYKLKVILSQNINICSVSVLKSEVPPPPTETPSMSPTVANKTLIPQTSNSLPSFDPLDTPDVTFQVLENTPDVIVPGTYSALSFIGFNDATQSKDGTCPVGTKKVTSDDICIDAAGNSGNAACAITNALPGESVMYRFATSGAKKEINLAFRLSSASASKKIQIQLYPNANGQSKILSSPGLGFQNYTDVRWDNVGLKNRSLHYMKVTFLDGKVNMCAFTVEYSS